jgi:hypothetical protein
MLSYIIATYAGKDHTSNKDIADKVLRLQMNELVALLENKKNKNITNYISEVIIVKPHVALDNTLPHYYDFSSWGKSLEKYSVKLHILDYIGDNKHHSYDQWIQGWSVATGDYYILCEDDYCLDSSNLTFEQDIIKHYKNTFPNNIGYLCTMVDSKYHGYHAAISNGIISKTTIQSMGNDILNTFYSINTSVYPQVNFSRLFLNANIDIKDFVDTYIVLFWNSYHQNIEIYTRNQDADKHIFIPVQFLI